MNGRQWLRRIAFAVSAATALLILAYFSFRWVTPMQEGSRSPAMERGHCPDGAFFSNWALKIQSQSGLQ
jgi:hypothetical protein